MRNLILWAGLGLALVVGNLAIVGKEKILSDGDIVLLRLAPVDPRSLLQGDYMALQYVVAQEVNRLRGDSTSANGRVVVTLDDNQVASFDRFDDGSSLAGGERLLRYRKRGRFVLVASNAFFFEEGQGDKYEDARYGELIVDDSGNALLVGLRDGEFNRIGT